MSASAQPASSSASESTARHAGSKRPQSSDEPYTLSASLATSPASQVSQERRIEVGRKGLPNRHRPRSSRGLPLRLGPFMHESAKVIAVYSLNSSQDAYHAAPVAHVFVFCCASRASTVAARSSARPTSPSANNT